MSSSPLPPGQSDAGVVSVVSPDGRTHLLLPQSLPRSMALAVARLQWLLPTTDGIEIAQIRAPDDPPDRWAWKVTKP